MIEEGLLLSNECFASRTEVNPLDPEMWFLRGNENKDVTIFLIN